MRTQSFYFSSSPAAGAQNLSADGSQFEVNFNTPLHVPAGATVCEMGLLSATVWNTSFNISAEFGNNIWRCVVGGATVAFSIADGLYSLDNLNSYINKALQNLGYQPDRFIISGDDATQRTVITIAAAGDAVDFTVANSTAQLLGFTTTVIIAATNGQHFYSPNEAKLNRTNLYLLTSDLVTTGVPVNALSRGVLGQVPIVVNPGEQDVFQPPNVQWFDASELIGRPRMNVRFALVNQDLKPVPTSGDSYSFVLQLRYE